MKARQILEEKIQLVTGTNCSNCKFSQNAKYEPVKKDELNEQGGMKITDKADLEKAKTGDLITLPGKGKTPTSKVMCKHKDISQWITERMCCAFWDAPGIIRSFGKKVVGK